MLPYLPRCLLLFPGVFGAAVLLAAPTCAQPRANPPAGDVMTAIRGDDWPRAADLAGQMADPLAEKLVTYYRLLAPGAASADEIAAFIAANPDWPQQDLLARRRDEALAAMVDDRAAAAFCRRAPPVLPQAWVRCAQAEAASGDAEAAMRAARLAWSEGIDDPAAEAVLVSRWPAALTPEATWQRFSRLISRDAGAAARALPEMTPAQQMAARAVLALRADQPDAADLVSSLPAESRTWPLVFLEHARWLRRAARNAEAEALWREEGGRVEQAAGDLRAAFTSERERLARQVLAAGDAEAAYAVIAAVLASGEAASLAIEPRAEALFLAGFIALESLHDAARAEPHFAALATVSPAVITKARAHYWLARTAEARGDQGRARAEYARSAAFPVTFYGQLAARALGHSPAALAADIRALRDPAATEAEASVFATQELARAAARLAAWGAGNRAQYFLADLAHRAPEASSRAIAARLSLRLGVPAQAVATARLAGRDGEMLPEAGWPIAVDVSPASMPAALVLGLIRQESSFDVAAVSPSGALGLMQLLPRTAQSVARKIGAPMHGAASLTSDAAFNIRLGVAYLADLMSRYDGAVPLVLAAYNGGPSHVAEWLAVNGDPRSAPAGTATIGWIDWIERIPFGETRNYVERVIENIVIYEAKRGGVAADPLTTSTP